jgi:predicted DNA repair protein MutK
MAGGSLLALIDDIATILDDVALMSKVAAKKTVGVLGDDLALNAQQVAGVKADRELPVVWAVAVGSLKNKAVLVPAALAISAFAPWAVTPLLMVGGAYLCYEGFEKLAHKFLHSATEDASHHAALSHAAADPAVDLVALERDKIKGAVRTDFILSAEIIVIALGSVSAAPFMQQVAVLIAIAVIMTVGVYGLVGAIVKIDDLGLYLRRRGGAALHAIGGVLLAGAPLLMKTLSVVGTAAMFTVGGNILMHGVPALHHLVERAAAAAGQVAVAGAVLAGITPTAIDAVAGLLAGAVVLLVVSVGQRLFKKNRVSD